MNIRILILQHASIKKKAHVATTSGSQPPISKTTKPKVVSSQTHLLLKDHIQNVSLVNLIIKWVLKQDLPFRIVES